MVSISSVWLPVLFSAAAVWFTSFLIWAVLPFLMGILGGLNRELRPLAEVYFDTNPFVHAVVITETAVRNPGSYRWFSFGGSQVSGAFTSTIWMLICAAGYGAVGLLFAWRAKQRFRRSVF